MSRQIHLGISTCPNDTFAFHAILKRKIDFLGLEFRTELLDVEELNQRLFAGQFDIAKASFHAALLLANDVGVLPSGSAIGFGVGPLLLAAKENTLPNQETRQHGVGNRPARILCPGQHTTASLLYQLFHPGEGEIEHVVFSDIMPMLQSGRGDFGVCIHEGRFTWKESGLALVEDLGQRWEQMTSAPLPLGGILARHKLGSDVIGKLQEVLRRSITYAHAHRTETLATMRKYAQEMSDEVIFNHVDLYVNEWTSSLGELGRGALNTLEAQARRVGAIPSHVSKSLVIFDERA